MSDNPSLNNFLLAKNERLVSAIYMVTNLMPETEPLKWKLREQALELVADFNLSFGFEAGLAGRPVVENPFGAVERLTNKIRGLVSLISIALSGGSVSQMNFTILKQEYLALEKILLDNFSATNFHSYLLSGAEKNIVGPTAGQTALAPVGFYQSPEFNQESNRETSASLSGARAKIPASHSRLSNPTPKSKSADGGQKEERRAAITSFLKGREWTSIKDIAKAVPGYSVKTVQRELVELVENGVLNKIGERRWSRYKLVRQS